MKTLHHISKNSETETFHNIYTYATGTDLHLQIVLGMMCEYAVIPNISASG